MSPLPPLVVLTPASRALLGSLARDLGVYPGPVRVLLWRGARPAGDDGPELVRAELVRAGVRAELAPPDGPGLLAALEGAGVVLGGPELGHDLAGALRTRRIPYVYRPAPPLRLRLDAVWSSGSRRAGPTLGGNGSRRAGPTLGGNGSHRAGPTLGAAREALAELARERAIVDQVRKAAAVECRGAPTYARYGRLAADALLTFDARVDADMTPAEGAVLERVERGRRRPIRLAFSGRLDAASGADRLPALAAALERRAIPFEVHVFGEGPLGAELRGALARGALTGRCVFHGPVDFVAGVFPFFREHADVLLGCERGGDPSSAHVEGFAAGLPLAGYLGDALMALRREAPRASVAARSGDAEALAEAVARLAGDPRALREASLAALAFGAEHVRSAAASRRMHYLVRLAEASAAARRDRKWPITPASDPEPVC